MACRDSERTSRLTSEKTEGGPLCPESYRKNSDMEGKLLSIVENFNRQYLHLFPERKPLLLCPENECGVKKFVCATLRPTPPSFPELCHWDGCASFVADFLSLEPLEPPVNLPSCVCSPSSVLHKQRGSCFDFSILLCSLLLGAGYDAYCVSGYASKHMCLLDQSLQECPLLHTHIKVVMSEQKSEENKYRVKPVEKLTSHFLEAQEKKKQGVVMDMSPQPTPEEDTTSHPPDSLLGLRVHCWVLVLSGCRDITENFFIEPLTGNRYSNSDDNFLGIESVWNHLNYYVNMQNCSNGCAGMLYDLEDLNMWEPVFYGISSRKQLIRAQRSNEIQMLRSWVSELMISNKDLETRWPGGKKATCYRKAQLEMFAPYLMSDGLVTRLITYKDLECSEVVMVKEWYKHRCDHVQEREIDKTNNITIERFACGQNFHLKTLRYETLSAVSDSRRHMEFYSAPRVDGLLERTEAPGEMTETFKGRDDFLYYRHVVFRRVQFSEPEITLDPDPRSMEKIVELFHRNRSKPAREDVAERVFLLAKRQIKLTYHLEENDIIPGTRVFIKPKEATETHKAQDFTLDLVSGYQVDPSAGPPQQHLLYEELLALTEEEEEATRSFIASKAEVRAILTSRQQEEDNMQLYLSPWSTIGVEKARQRREERERQAEEEQRWLQEKETDFLAPYLIRHGDPDTLNSEDAQQIHQEYLGDSRQLQKTRADIIQGHYDKQTEELQKKQQWYQQNQLSLNRQQEEEYQQYCRDATLRIKVITQRLRKYTRTHTHMHTDRHTQTHTHTHKHTHTRLQKLHWKKSDLTSLQIRNK
ncbi:dynein regulatory complex subunit 7 [Genypterus blacodes]|uniref:dynein regulatory complex subunit 7 n=1 Tax=Genypterus blacodes TaxID=154954 RepID=UPI003F776018